MTGDEKILSIEKKLQAIINYQMKAIVKKAMDEQDDYILELNKEQLAEGIDNKGSDITPPYKPVTIEKKQAKGQRVDKVTLFDTGEWQGAMKVETYKDKKSIVSTDFKEPLLQGKYGEDIEGLTNDNLYKVSQAMVTTEIKELRKYIEK